MSTSDALHAYGFEEIEDSVPVHETYKAKCNLCSWEGEEHDEMDWKGAEEEAVEHFRDEHIEPEDEDEEEE